MPHKSLAALAHLMHTRLVPETTGTGFSSLKSLRRTLRHLADFLRPSHPCAPSMGGRLRGGFGLPVSVVTGLLTLLSARPPHLAVDGGLPTHTEAAMRANALARPEQIHPPSPSTVCAFPVHSSPLALRGFALVC